MYNEVFKKCPNCENRCEKQIGQIVLGFGGFNLDDTDSLAEQLTDDQLVELKEALKGERFWCQIDEGGCGTSFMLGTQDDDRKKLAKRLFGEPDSELYCPCCGHPNCGYHHV